MAATTHSRLDDAIEAYESALRVWTPASRDLSETLSPLARAGSIVTALFGGLLSYYRLKPTPEEIAATVDDRAKIYDPDEDTLAILREIVSGG